jgi:ribonuclease E
VSKEMLINFTEGEECRIAIVENGRLEELYMERASTGSRVGNIYKGRVTNVEPSIQAAFVDFGLDKNGFLHISDVQPSYFRNGHGESEDVGRKTGRRDRPPIQECLRRGQEVLVQITKEGIGTKGPTLTTYLSIPGRYLVLMPGMSRMGVSRKIEDEDIRRKLRGLLEQLEPPDGMGFIIRTAGVDRTKTDLQRDLNYLVRLWRSVERNVRSVKAPAELYQESDLVIRTIRDVYTDEIGRIICDNEEIARKAADFLAIAMPRSRGRVELYRSHVPLFHRCGIEQEIENIHSRTVRLPSGGSLVIDQTEALVAIDVNSGKFRDPDNAEQTAYQINCEAAAEIARQLRLRDLGGVIACDFIDMIEERHQRGVERALAEAMHKDRARSKCLRMSRFGIIEMTRQRLRPSLRKSVYHNCPTCSGGGMVKTPESVCLDVMRLLQLAVVKEAVKTIEVYTTPGVAEYLNNKKRRVLADMEEKSGKRIVVKLREHLGAEQLELKCFDGRGIEVRFNAAEFVGPAKEFLFPLEPTVEDRIEDRYLEEPEPEPEIEERVALLDEGAGEYIEEPGDEGFGAGLESEPTVRPTRDRGPRPERTSRDERGRDERGRDERGRDERGSREYAGRRRGDDRGRERPRPQRDERLGEPPAADEEPGFGYIPEEEPEAEPLARGGPAVDEADEEPVGADDREEGGPDEASGNGEERGGRRRRRRRRRRGRGRGEPGEGGEEGVLPGRRDAEGGPEEPAAEEFEEPQVPVEAPRRPARDARRDAVRRDEVRRDDARRDEVRRDEVRRDEGRGGDARRDEVRRDERRFGEGPRADEAGRSDFEPFATALETAVPARAVADVTFDNFVEPPPAPPSPAAPAKPTRPVVDFVEEEPEQEFGAGIA